MPPSLSLTLLMVFASVALVTGVVASVALTWTNPARRQLRRLSASAGEREAVLVQMQLAESSAAWVKRFQQVLPRSPAEISRLRRRLTAAGYRGVGAATLYGAAETVLPLVLGSAALLVVGLGRWYIVLLAALAGYLLPGMWLSRETARRQRLLRHGLPDALDLMIVCIEAGSSVDQALLKSSDELDIAHPALAEELRLVTTEMRAGKPRLDALRNFASRTRVDEVRSLVSMLAQTDRFGTSVAQALRTHADVSRTKRRQDAEERAAKVGVKLVFPLVFCLFPALYVAVLGPAVVQYVRHFKIDVIQTQGK